MPKAVAVEETDFHGWDGVRLSNGMIDAVCVPEIGGRLMQFSLGPHDYLFMNPDLLGKRFTFEEHAGDGTIVNWKNYGGAKTWPAPQGWDGEGQWPGPPDPVLDSGRYEYETNQDDASASVLMTSPPDERSGLRIRRLLSVETDNSRLLMDLSFENISNREIRWSIWDVAQMLCRTADCKLNDDCWLYIPTDPARERPYEIMFGDDNPQYQLDAESGLLAVQYQGIVGKIGVHSPAGWIAFADKQSGFVLCMQFPYEPDAEYPDNGATVECWTESPGAPSPIPIRSPGYILEAEVLSPLCTLQPGKVASQRVTWSAAFCPAPIVAVTDFGCAHRTLTVNLDGGWARIRGIFGCFLDGRAEIECLDEAGDVVSRLDLGPVSPLRVLRLDAATQLNDATSLIRLNILDMDGTYAGTLDSILLNESVQSSSGA
ncbi:MAG: DUF4380 domain-containing protein [Chloroflexi bacterium]|nr:DUF4380 domain-containing protein [Chloroflexota bacterium]